MTSTGGNPNKIYLDEVSARAMAVRLPVVGLAVRIHSDGSVHPWCAALAFPGEYERATKFLMAMPDGIYVSPPRHPDHGDLINLPWSVEQQANAMCRLLRDRSETGVLMSDAWAETSLAIALGIRGITVFTVRAYDPVDVPDPYGIGGDEGQDIALLLDADRREYAVWYHLDGGRYEVDEHTTIN